MPAVGELRPHTLSDASDASGRMVALRIELGHTDLMPDRACRLCAGAVVALDQAVREPVQIFADGQLIARGETIVLENKLCVRVTERLASRDGL